jgi:outer membrane protein assembly factor BamD
VHVAKYYLNRGAYIAAVNRAQQALTNYPRTPANEDALIVIVQSYDRMGMDKLRDDNLRVLKDTFPNGKYFNPPDTPWWKFWAAKDTLPPAVDAVKPWWQFW